jgi:SSS family solute:Na+ symporter
LAQLDLVIIVGYLVLAFAISLYFSKQSGKSTESYFLAGRSLPGWLAGISIAATTFAADTPLAITGIIAAKGIAGNWLWYAWILAHVLVAVLFSKYWRRAEIMTDSELTQLRYSGPEAGYLRLFRAGLSGILINVIVMGWVIRAMVKVASQFFDWEAVFPGLISFVDSYLVWGSGMGTGSEVLSLVSLILLVSIYSYFGGIRGVIFTDVMQFSLALLGAFWLMFVVLNDVGGMGALLEKLNSLYGESQTYTSFLPSGKMDWVASFELGAGAFGLYLFFQGFSNVNVDGGGYIMQRLSTTKDDKQAQVAMWVFVFIHYFVRLIPWFVVALAALVIFPIGQEAEVFNGAYSQVGGDRNAGHKKDYF